MDSLPFHLGPSAWDQAGRLFAVAYPATLMVADSGQPEDLLVCHVFADEPTDVRGLFIAADGSLFIGLKGFKRGSFGRTLRSVDGGLTFTEVLDRCFWGIDQDSTGNLFVGCYHEREEPGQECAVYKSPDGGVRWINLAAPEWHEQTHVHGLAISPDNGWLYATLGDKDGFDGCWRMRNRSLQLLNPAVAGSTQLNVGAFDNTVAERLTAVLHDGNGAERVEILSVADGVARLSTPLARTYAPRARLDLLDWVNKFRSAKADAQYVGIAFKGRQVYLSDDNPIKKNPCNAVVYCAGDDGSDLPVEPKPILSNKIDAAWGSFFLKKDAAERLWVAVRPFQGKGRLWCGDGKAWQLVMETPEEPLEAWRINHTFRDMSYGRSGDGRCQFSPQGIGLLSGSGAIQKTPEVFSPGFWGKLRSLFGNGRSIRRVG